MPAEINVLMDNKNKGEKMNNIVKSVILSPFNLLYKLNPKLELQLLFLLKLRYPLNLRNPKTYNEKLQWIKLYDKDQRKPKCVDKYTVREFVQERGCGELLNTLLWEGRNPEEIPFDELPDQFVIKATHGQGMNIICKDKSSLDREETIKKLKRWLKFKYLPCYGEWFYGVVPPKIIVEAFLSEDGECPKDYKVFCFHGEPKLIDIHMDRFIEHKRNFYDLEWKVIENASIKYPTDTECIIPKPENLDELLEYARKLSKDFLHVRVDFYIVNGKIYFGEMTFTNGAGFDSISPREFDEWLGSMI